MQRGFLDGYMFVKDYEDLIQQVPVKLGQAELHPGEIVSKLGHKKRSMIEMQEGTYLQYLGQVEEVIIFKQLPSGKDWCYGFCYIDKNTLLVQSSECTFWDIRIDTVEVIQDPVFRETIEQMTLF